MAQNLVPRRCGNIKTSEQARGTDAEMSALMASIASCGMIHPPVIDSNNKIVAGRRRLEAAKRLGWPFITVIQCDTYDDQLKALEAERDENQCRVKYTPSEIKEQADVMRAILEPEAAKRQAHGKTAPGQRLSQLGTSVPEEGRVSATIAAVVGVSEEQLRKIEIVHEAAEADPMLGHLPEQMDETGKVDPAYQEVVAKKPRKARKPKATTKGEDLKDEIGQAVPANLRDLFGDLSLTDCHHAAEEMLTGLKNVAKKLKQKGTVYKYLLLGDILKSIDSACLDLEIIVSKLHSGLPYAVHKKCSGKGCNGGNGCRQGGLVNQARYEELVKEGAW